MVVYFVFASGDDKQQLRKGILLLPILPFSGLVFFGVFYNLVLTPSSKFWSSGAVRAIISAFTRGHSEGISAVVVLDHPKFHHQLLLTSGLKDGKIKVWHAEKGNLIRSFMGHEYGILSMHANSSNTKLYTSGVGKNELGEVREWDLTDSHVRVPNWTARFADVKQGEN